MNKLEKRWEFTPHTYTTPQAVCIVPQSSLINESNKRAMTITPMGHIETDQTTVAFEVFPKVPL